MLGKPGKVVIAIGGNAITREYEEGEIHEQFANTRRTSRGIIQMIKAGWKVLVTHGNGPQVGNSLIRVEIARNNVPVIPLGMVVADIQGGMGYMIQQSLNNRLVREGLNRHVVSVVTQVLVSPDDPSVKHPTKPIGPFYSEGDANELMRSQDWIMIEDSGRGWRRVVPSPKPLSVHEAEAIQELVDAGQIVIAAGGGGIPVYLEDDGTLEGIDAVIDKDRTAAVLAENISADTLIILTQVEKVFINFGKPNEEPLDKISLEEAKKYYAEGHFLPGSMGPKIEAIIKFLENGGQQALITATDKLPDALAGNTGTVICR